LMDRIIQGARNRGLKIILDRHDTTADLRPELWYTNQVPEKRWIHDWIMLARHYRGNETIIGADLANEPHGPSTWGDGHPRTTCRRSGSSTGPTCKWTEPLRCYWASSEGALRARTLLACGSAAWWPSCTRRASAIPTGRGTPTRGIPAASSRTIGPRSTRTSSRC